MAHLSIRIDDDIKAEAERLFQSMGLNLSSAVNIFIRQSIARKEIPFKISAQAENDRLYFSKLEKSKEQADNGDIIEKDLSELRSME
jgi:DNA-damage-inducible protein J